MLKKSSGIFMGLIFVVFNTLGYAENSAENDATNSNAYIVVLKEKPSISGHALLLSTGETVRQFAERVIDEVEQEQRLIDNQRGVKRVAPDVLNRLGHVYEHVLKGFSATLTPAALKVLQDNPMVDYIEPDGIGTVDSVQISPPNWGLDRIDQPDLPLDSFYEYLSDGTGVDVYIFDSGVRLTHSEYVDRVGAGIDFVDEDYDASDCFGHGTHVTGIVAGVTYGVAKGVTLRPYRVLDCSGYGFTSDAILAFNDIYLYELSRSLRPAVVNVSVGYPPNQALDHAVRSIISTGTLVVASAGNDASDACGQSPARVADVITVASTTVSDQRAWDSNFGSCVDIFAPGVDIRSAWHTSDNATAVKSGTSMAAPHVTGVVAQYLAQNPTATSAEVTAAILGNATPNKVINPGSGSANLLLYSDLPSEVPPEEPPIDEPPFSYDLAWLIPVTNLILFN